MALTLRKQKMNAPQLTIVFFVLMISQSCRPLYVPNIHNVPLLKEKKDVSVTLNPNELQGAYAVTNNIGVMLNLYKNNVNFTFDYEGGVSRSLCEVGVGCFKKFGKFGVFEIYGGYGIGGLEFGKSSGANDFYSANTSRIFLQPNIGFSNKFLDIILSTRLFSYSLNDPDLSRYQGPDTFDFDLSHVHEKSYLYIEPAITIKLGWKQAKFFIQQIIPIPLNNERNVLEALPIAYIGVYLNFSKTLKEEIPDLLTN
jgi:hypothetical protein